MFRFSHKTFQNQNKTKTKTTKNRCLISLSPTFATTSLEVINIQPQVSEKGKSGERKMGGKEKAKKKKVDESFFSLFSHSHSLNSLFLPFFPFTLSPTTQVITTNLRFASYNAQGLNIQPVLILIAPQASSSCFTSLRCGGEEEERKVSSPL